MKLILFTCSTINDRFLFDQVTPWKYVSLNPRGNNLESDICKIRQLSRNNKITIIIGNTDPYYIYTQSFTIFSNLSNKLLWEKYDARWKTYKKNLNTWLNSNQVKNYTLISWWEFEIQIKKQLGIDFDQLFQMYLPKVGTYFSASDFSWELKKLQSTFNKDGYFKTLQSPSKSTLKMWVRRKFTEYMLQGLLIYIFFPGTTLIQNEKPTLLRNKMYQPLIKKFLSSQLPVICPFGIDDASYQ